MKLEMKQETVNALNFQYKCDTFHSHMTPSQIVKCAETAMRRNIDAIDYELTGWDIQKYGIRLNPCQKDPFVPEEYQHIQQLIAICESLMGCGQSSSPGKVNVLLNKLMTFVVNGGRVLQLSERYHKYKLYFKKVSFKDAIIFEVLNKCQIFYTIMRERKKSGKAFFLDPLIAVFEDIQRKLEISHPFHQNVLPKKQLRFFQKKITDKKMKNALFDAVSNCNYKEVRELLAKGNSLSQPGICERQQMREMYCQHRACQIADLQMCRILHSYKPNWEVTDKQGLTPLHYAVQSGKLALVQFLIEEVGVQLSPKDIQNRTPFYFACTEGDLSIIRYLYDKKADINNKSKLGRSALSKACYLGLVDVVNFLLACPGIQMNIQDGKGRTALHNAVFGPKGGREGHKFGTNQKDSPECTQLLLQNGFDVDYPDKENNTPLHVAMSSDGRDSIRVLIAFGASLTRLNCYGETPLMTGAKFGHIQAVRMLKEDYGASLAVKDIFQKNLMLLCAKFRQNDGKEVNQVFYYSTNQLLSCFREESEKVESKVEKQELIVHWQEEVDYTFQQLLKERKRVEEEFTYFCRKLIQYKLRIRNFRVDDLKMLIGSFKAEENSQAEVIEYLVARSDPITLTLQEYKQFGRWILFQNNTALLQFAFKIEQDIVNYVKLKKQEKISLHEILAEIIFQSFCELKEKILTFCLLRMNIDWVGYSDQHLGYNIIHLLVKCKKLGTLIQVLKVLSGSNLLYPTNSYLVPLFDQYEKIDSKQQSLLSCELRRLLLQKNRDGLDPHSMALLLKDAAAAKLIEEKLKILSEKVGEKCQGESKIQLQVKEYKVRLQQQAAKLQIFNKGFDLEKELEELQAQIQNLDEKELECYFSILREKPGDISTQVNIDEFQIVWRQSHNRKLTYIRQVEEVEILNSLSQESILGLDIEYFYTSNHTLISIMQISSLTQDYILDFLSSAQTHSANYQFRERVAEILRPIAGNKKITKVMHGSDNDLCVIKSVLNISFLNFLDTARLQIEISKQQNIRGLATLLQQYLKTHMPKDYQVSEWRIRPIPASMLEYARKDSMALPFLARKLLMMVQRKKLKTILIGGCRQARKNKKPNQSLISSIQAL